MIGPLIRVASFCGIIPVSIGYRTSVAEVFLGLMKLRDWRRTVSSGERKCVHHVADPSSKDGTWPHLIIYSLRIYTDLISCSHRQSCTVSNALYGAESWPISAQMNQFIELWWQTWLPTSTSSAILPMKTALCHWIELSSTAQACHSFDKLVILAVLSAPAAPSHTSPPAGTRSISASALSPPGRSRTETELNQFNSFAQFATSAPCLISVCWLKSEIGIHVGGIGSIYTACSASLVAAKSSWQIWWHKRTFLAFS